MAGTRRALPARISSSVTECVSDIHGSYTRIGVPIGYYGLPMRLATIGKGGVGKSFVTGTLARLLARQGHKVLVLDSDPMPGVAISLGMGPLEDEMLKDAVEKDADGNWALKKGIGPATAVRRFAYIGPDGVRLLQYGKSDEEGLRKIRGSMQGFTRVVHRLARDDVMQEWSVLGDLPAGPRHTAFNWAPYASTYIVVVEPTWQSLLTARRVKRLAEARGDARSLIVANKVKETSDVKFIEENLGAGVTTVVPSDPLVQAADRAGVAPIDRDPNGPAVSAVASLTKLLSP